MKFFVGITFYLLFIINVNADPFISAKTPRDLTDAGYELFSVNTSLKDKKILVYTFVKDKYIYACKIDINKQTGVVSVNNETKIKKYPFDPFVCRHITYVHPK